MRPANKSNWKSLLSSDRWQWRRCGAAYRSRATRTVCDAATFEWQHWVTVSPEFGRVLNRMLSYQPGDRYQSVAQEAQAPTLINQLLRQSADGNMQAEREFARAGTRAFASSPPGNLCLLNHARPRLNYRDQTVAVGLPI